VTTVAVRDDAGQPDLVAALSGTNKALIVVGLRDPYDIAYLVKVPCYLASYSSTDAALDALARVLLGRLTPEGRLPVDIPPSAEPAAIGYPIGAGLDLRPCL
jgi:beta-N-acetylhexosaminidase